MAAGFNIYANLNMKGPFNTAPVINELQRQLKSTSIKLDVDVNTKTLAQAKQQITQIYDITGQTSSAFRNLGEQTGIAAKRLTAYVAAAGSFFIVVNTLKAAISEAISFQKELVRLAQVSGDSSKRIGEIAEEVTRLATTFGVSSKELISAAATLRQAGFTASETKTALEALAKTDLAPSFENIKATTEGVIAITRQFRTEAKDLERDLGAINAVAAGFAVESSDLIEAIKRTGGAFRTAGGDLNELIALFTSVRATTRESADTIATGFRTIFGRLQRNDVAQSFKELGIDIRRTRDEAVALGDVRLEGQFVGAYEAVRRLNAALKDLPETDPRYAAIAEQIGGIRQISKVIPLIQEFETAEKARQVALTGSISLDTAAIQSQQAYARQLSKVREELLALGRSFVSSEGFKTLFDTFVIGARAAIQLVDAIRPLIPLLATLAAIKIGSGLLEFSSGVQRGLFSRPGESLSAQNQNLTIRQRFASGGSVFGEGSGDTVPAMLTPGEFVVRKDVVKKFGPQFFQQLNAKGYAKGGPVGFATGGSVEGPGGGSVFTLLGTGLRTAQATLTRLAQEGLITVGQFSRFNAILANQVDIFKGSSKVFFDLQKGVAATTTQVKEYREAIRQSVSIEKQNQAVRVNQPIGTIPFASSSAIPTDIQSGRLDITASAQRAAAVKANQKNILDREEVFGIRQQLQNQYPGLLVQSAFSKRSDILPQLPSIPLSVARGGNIPFLQNINNGSFDQRRGFFEDSINKVIDTTRLQAFKKDIDSSVAGVVSGGRGVAGLPARNGAFQNLLFTLRENGSIQSNRDLTRTGTAFLKETRQASGLNGPNLNPLSQLSINPTQDDLARAALFAPGQGILSSSNIPQQPILTPTAPNLFNRIGDRVTGGIRRFGGGFANRLSGGIGAGGQNLAIALALGGQLDNSGIGPQTGLGGLAGFQLGSAFGPLAGILGGVAGAGVGAVTGTAKQEREKQLAQTTDLLNKSFDTFAQQLEDFTNGKGTLNGLSLSISEALTQIKSKTAQETNPKFGAGEQFVARASFGLFGHDNREGSFGERVGDLFTFGTSTREKRVNSGDIIRKETENVRNQFGPQLSNITLGLSKNIDQLVEKFGKVGIGADGITEAFVSANKDLIEIVAIVKKTTTSEVIQDFAKQIKDAAKAAGDNRNRRQVEFAVNRDIAGFSRFTPASSQAASTASVADQFLKLVSDRIEGKISSASIRNISSDLEFGRPKQDDFQKALKAATLNLGPQGNRLNNIGSGLDTATRVLPDVLSRTLQSSGLNGDSFVNKFQDILGQAAPDLPKEITRLLVSKLEDLKPEEIIQKLREAPDKFAESLLADYKPIHDTLQKLAQDIENQGNKLLQGFAVVQQFEQIRGEGQDRLSQLRLQQTKSNAELRISETRPLDFVSLTQLNKPFQDKLERLSGLKGGAATNPDNIANALAIAEDKVGISQKRLDNTNPADRTGIKIAAEELSKVQIEALNLQKALKTLAESGERAANAQLKLSALIAERDERRNFAKTLLTSDVKGVANINQGFFGAALAQRIGIDNIPVQIRQQIFQSLDAVKNIKLKGFGGQTGEEVQRDLIKNSVIGRLVGFGEPQESEIERLKKAIEESNKTQIDAQKEIVEKQGTDQAKFISDLKSQFDVFFTELRNNVKRQQDITDSVEKVRIGGEIKTAEGKVQAADVLKGAGVDSDEKLKFLRNNQGLLGDFFDTSKRQRGLEQQKNLAIDRLGPAVVEATNQGLTDRSRRSLEAGLQATQVIPKDLIASIISAIENDVTSRVIKNEDIDRKIAGVSAEANRFINPISNEEAGTRIDELRKQKVGGFTPQEFQQIVNRNIGAAFDNRIQQTEQQRVVAEKKFKEVGIDPLGLAAKSKADIEKAVSSLGPTIQGIDEQLQALRNSLTKFNNPVEKAGGGSIFRARGTDTVPAMLTPGEFVVNASSARQNIGLLQKINSGGAAYFDDGGIVIDPRNRKDQLALAKLNRKRLFGNLLKTNPLNEFFQQGFAQVGNDFGGFLTDEQRQVKENAFGAKNQAGQTADIKSAYVFAFFQDQLNKLISYNEQAARLKGKDFDRLSLFPIVNQAISKFRQLPFQKQLAAANSLESRFRRIVGGGGSIDRVAALINNPIQEFAGGGFVGGRSGGDVIPAYLSSGEFVMNRRAVKNVGAGNLQYFNTGGTVDSADRQNNNQFAVTDFTERFLVAANIFNGTIDKLIKITDGLQKIPTSIHLEASHKVEIILNGADVLRQIMPDVAKLIVAVTAEKFRRLTEGLAQFGIIIGNV